MDAVETPPVAPRAHALRPAPPAALALAALPALFAWAVLCVTVRGAWALADFSARGRGGEIAGRGRAAAVAPTPHESRPYRS
jgi:hypothetical protein